jgi:hypothetical protein
MGSPHFGPDLDLRIGAFPVTLFFVRIREFAPTYEEC